MLKQAAPPKLQPPRKLNPKLQPPRTRTSGQITPEITVFEACDGEVGALSTTALSPTALSPTALSPPTAAESMEGSDVASVASSASTSVAGVASGAAKQRARSVASSASPDEPQRDMEPSLTFAPKAKAKSNTAKKRSLGS